MEKRILYALPMPSPAEPSAVGGESSAGAPRHFEKELIREGVWTHPTKKFTIRVTLERMRRWLEAFTRMKEAGLKVPLPFGHSYDPRDNAGFLEDLRLEGNRLIGLLAIARPEDAERIGTTIRDVSICINPDFVDAKGNRYGEVIEHVALTNYPVVEGQGEFRPVERIAAGDDGEAEIWTFTPQRLKNPSSPERHPAEGASGEEVEPRPDDSAPEEREPTAELRKRGEEPGEATDDLAGESREPDEDRTTPPTAGEALVEELAALRLELAREREERIAAEVAAHVAVGRIPPAAAADARALLACTSGRRFDLDRRSEVGVDIAGTFRRFLSMLPAGAAVDVSERTRHLRPMPNPGNGQLAAARATAAAAKRMLESRGYSVVLSEDGTTILEASKGGS